MNERWQTDFLTPTSTFLSGVGSVLSLSGGYFPYNHSEDPDELAMWQDWRMVGQDLEAALSAAPQQLPVADK